MQSYTVYLTRNIPDRRDFVNITDEVADAVRDSGICEGLCLVNAMHITASVFVNDDEPGLHADYKRWLEKLAPHDPSPQAYQHNRTGEDNDGRSPHAADHGARGGGCGHRRQARLRPLGALFYGELDGRRPKRVLVKVIGE